MDWRATSVIMRTSSIGSSHSCSSADSFWGAYSPNPLHTASLHERLASLTNVYLGHNYDADGETAVSRLPKERRGRSRLTGRHSRASAVAETGRTSQDPPAATNKPHIRGGGDSPRPANRRRRRRRREMNEGGLRRDRNERRRRRESTQCTNEREKGRRNKRDRSEPRRRASTPPSNRRRRTSRSTWARSSRADSRCQSFFS